MGKKILISTEDDGSIQFPTYPVILTTNDLRQLLENAGIAAYFKALS